MTTWWLYLSITLCPGYAFGSAAKSPAIHCDFSETLVSWYFGNFDMLAIRNSEPSRIHYRQYPLYPIVGLQVCRSCVCISIYPCIIYMIKLLYSFDDLSPSWNLMNIHSSDGVEPLIIIKMFGKPVCLTSRQIPWHSCSIVADILHTSHVSPSLSWERSLYDTYIFFAISVALILTWTD